MKKEKTKQALLYCALAIVMVVVVWGFALVGSPSYNRKLSADRERIGDFQALSTGIQQYYKEYKELPEKLADLGKLRYPYHRDQQLKDPTTGKLYEYNVKNLYAYELCAEFELTSEDAEIERLPYNHYTRDINWNHGIGFHCIAFEISPGNREK